MIDFDLEMQALVGIFCLHLLAAWALVEGICRVDRVTRGKQIFRR